MVDSHAQVRESAVELIGRFVLYDEEYVRKYYSQIAERILDTGVAVRKRVIRIMREICEKFPTFEMIPGNFCSKNTFFRHKKTEKY